MIIKKIRNNFPTNPQLPCLSNLAPLYWLINPKNNYFFIKNIRSFQYAVILSLVFIFKLVIVCMAFTMDGETLINSFNIPVWNMDDPEVQAEVDYLQSSVSK